MRRLLLAQVALMGLVLVLFGCASTERAPEAESATRPRPDPGSDRIGNPDLRVLLPGVELTEGVVLKRGGESFATYDLHAPRLSDVILLLEDATYERLRELAIQILRDPPQTEGAGQEVLLDLLMRQPDVERSGLARSRCKLIHRPGERADVDELVRTVEGLLDEHRSDSRPR